jgi:hypothetical protein
MPNFPFPDLTNRQRLGREREFAQAVLGMHQDAERGARGPGCCPRGREGAQLRWLTARRHCAIGSTLSEPASPMLVPLECECKRLDDHAQHRSRASRLT